jgi:hypothetical protein
MEDDILLIFISHGRFENVTNHESSVTDDIPLSISTSRDEILLVSEEFHLLQQKFTTHREQIRCSS